MANVLILNGKTIAIDVGWAETLTCAMVSARKLTHPAMEDVHNLMEVFQQFLAPVIFS